MLSGLRKIKLNKDLSKTGWTNLKGTLISNFLKFLTIQCVEVKSQVDCVLSACLFVWFVLEMRFVQPRLTLTWCAAGDDLELRILRGELWVQSCPVDVVLEAECRATCIPGKLSTNGATSPGQLIMFNVTLILPSGCTLELVFPRKTFYGVD